MHTRAKYKTVSVPHTCSQSLTDGWLQGLIQRHGDKASLARLSPYGKDNQMLTLEWLVSRMTNPAYSSRVKNTKQYQADVANLVSYLTPQLATLRICAHQDGDYFIHRDVKTLEKLIAGLALAKAE